MFRRGLWDSEVLEFHEFFTPRLPVENKYAVEISITYLNLIGNEVNVIMAACGKMQMWS